MSDPEMERIKSILRNFNFTKPIPQRHPSMPQFKPVPPRQKPCIFKQKREQLLLLERRYRIKIEDEEYKIITSMSIKFKSELKAIPPEGYFRSIHTKRLVKDTEKNRFRETLAPDDIVGSIAYFEKIIKKIDSEKDPIDRNVLKREYSVDYESLLDKNITHKWEYMSPEVKISTLKKMYDKTKETNKNHDQFAKERIKVDRVVDVKPLKPRNMTSYVSPSTIETDVTIGTGDAIVKINDIEWDELMMIENSAKIVLKPYQIKAINHMKRNHGIIICFDTGSGKTITSVVASLLLLSFDIVKNVYVIAPKSLSSNFFKELKYYISDEDPESTALKEKIKCFTHTKFVNTFRNTPELCDDSLLIVDEASEFRTGINTSSQTGKSAHTIINCCIRAKRVMCLSATPLYNEFSDITNLIAMAKGQVPKMMPSTFKNKMEYVKDVFTFHSLREDSLPEKVMSMYLPERREHIQEFIMTDEYYREYLKIQRSQNDSSSDPFVFLGGLRRGTNSIKPNPKVEWALDRVRDLKLKTVLYSAFIDDGIRLLQDGLDSRNIKYVTISGEIGLTERETSVKKYNSGEVNVMIISKAGSLGLDLKKTKEIILLESSWNSAQEEQVIGRACRLGSHFGLPDEELFVDIYRLYLFKPSIEKLAPGDNYPSADAILKGILERKKRSLEIYYYLLRSMDIDSEKAAKYRPKFDDLEKTFMQSRAKTYPEEIPKGNPKGNPNHGMPPRPKQTSYETPYKILGVPEGSSIDECRRAFKKHALNLHPDRNYNDSAVEREAKLLLFKKISNAMDRLDSK